MMERPTETLNLSDKDRIKELLAIAENDPNGSYKAVWFLKSIKLKKVKDRIDAWIQWRSVYDRDEDEEDSRMVFHHFERWFRVDWQG